MAATFYNQACNVDAKATPFGELKSQAIATSSDNGSLFFMKPADGGKVYGPHSIMNDHVSVNYRTIYNGYAVVDSSGNPVFTEYDDYLRAMQAQDDYREYLRDIKNPTYKNIIHHYSGENSAFDPHGLARYKMQDFIYLKYYNQIPNNYMITLRRYTRPCTDHMFGLDLDSSLTNQMNGLPECYFALATAVTYMGEKTGNKLSDILKFEYGAKWTEKEGKVETIKNSDGGLAAQLAQKSLFGSQAKVSDMNNTGGMDAIHTNPTEHIRGIFLKNAAAAGKGISNGELNRRINSPDGNEFASRYGEEFYGDLNVVNSMKMRERGLTFTNSFSLTFEYSLKSLKCVNPRIAMMDILMNFLILTGNYGEFWGGATLFYGNNSIAPQYGDPKKLRNGDYWGYIKSVGNDIMGGLETISDNGGGGAGGFISGLGDILKGGLNDLLGSLLGGNIGVAGQSQAVPALLSGNPTGYWHVTVGNPLDPIAMMGNMAVTKTTVQFSDVLGYDDFPTEVKFTVDLEHCIPRDNGMIESMFNGAKGRFYTFTDTTTEDMMHNIDPLSWAQNPEKTGQNQQEMNIAYDKNSIPQAVKGRGMSVETMKIIGGNLQN